MSTRTILLSHPEGYQEEVTLEAMSALVALSKQKIYFCAHCADNKANGTLIYHLQNAEDELHWDTTVAAIQAETPTNKREESA